MSDKIFPAISSFFKNTGIAAQGVDETSFLILAGVVILFVILFFTFVLLAKNRKITLPWALLSGVFAFGILFYFALSKTSGTLVFMPSKQPEEVSSSFMTAVCMGEEDLASSLLASPMQLDIPLNQPDEAALLLEQSLKDSYSCEAAGAPVLDGTNAKQNYKFTSLNVTALVPDILAEVDKELEYKVENSKKSDVYDKDNNYRTDVLEEIYQSAIVKVLQDAPSYYTQSLIGLELTYQNGEWKVLPNNSLQLALNGSSSSGANYANNIKSEVLGDLTFIPKVYTLAEDATKGPVPNPNKYGITEDPNEIVKLIAEYPQLVGDKEPFFDPNADFLRKPIEYYADDTILAVVWKERVLGHGCNFAEVYIADPSQFRRKFSMDTYGSPVQKYGSELAKESNAVVAMNGDFYKFRAEGMTVYNRTLYRFNPVKLELCHVNSDGELLFTYAGELASKEQAEQYVKDNDVLFTLAFGPVLIADGEPHISSNSYLIGEVNTRYSRSILSTRGNGHYLLTTCNNGYGTPTCTIAEARDMMMSKKVENAYVLDGGQTAEIIIRDHVSNHIDFDTERTVSDILYFATALPEDENN